MSVSKFPYNVSFKISLQFFGYCVYFNISNNSFKMNLLRKEKVTMFKKLEKGQGLVEYALILVLVAIVVIAALIILGPTIANVFNKISTNLKVL